MKRFVLLVCLVLSVGSLFAAVVYSPSFEPAMQVSFFRHNRSVIGGYGGFYLSSVVNLDLNFFGLSTNSFDFSGGVSITSVSRSFIVDNGPLQGYEGAGLFVGLRYYFTDLFSIGLKGRVKGNLIRPAGIYLFMDTEVELSPGFTVFHKTRYKFDIRIPVSVGFRKDGIALRAGLGISAGVK